MRGVQGTLGYHTLQVFIHRDEGHYSNPEDIATWKPNLHAHIVWDWMNHETGKSCKLDDVRNADRFGWCLEAWGHLQTEKHLERNDFIIAKQKQEAERSKPKKRMLPLPPGESRSRATIWLRARTRRKNNTAFHLTMRLPIKERQLKDERKAKMDSILDSVGSIVGVGKSAAVEKENTQLKTEIERIKKAFPNAVKNKVEELTKTLVEAKQSAEAERDRALAQSRSSITERNEAVKQLQAQEADIQQRISQAVLTATKKKDNTIRLLQGALEASRKILNVIADILYQASEVFRRAVNAIIHFGTEQHKSIFAPSEAADIKSVMQEYGETTEIQKAVGDWLCGYAEDRQPFDEIKHRHTLKEVGDVAEGAYDWKIEKNRNNGIHL